MGTYLTAACNKLDYDKPFLICLICHAIESFNLESICFDNTRTHELRYAAFCKSSLHWQLEPKQADVTTLNVSVTSYSPNRCLFVYVVTCSLSTNKAIQVAQLNELSTVKYPVT